MISLKLYETQISHINLGTFHVHSGVIKYAYIYLCRSVRTEEPIWGEDESFSDHDYYNSIPGKEPPIGGVVDSRLRGNGALLGHIHSQLQGYTTAQVTLHTVSTVNCDLI